MGNNPKSNDPNVVHDAHENNHFGKILFIFSMVFVSVFFIYITFIHPHSSPDHVKAIQQTVEAAAPVATAPTAKPGDQPWVSTPEKMAKGKEIFDTNCALCHGPKGLGDGPAGAALNPKPRNYGEGKWKQGNSTIALFNTVSKGVPGSSMAPYEGVLTNPADRWAVVLYVKTLGKNIVDPTDAEIKAYTEKNK